MELNVFFRSIIDQDTSEIIICDLNDTVLYMNSAAIDEYCANSDGTLVGKSLLDCHSPESNKAIQKVKEWFAKDVNNNIIHTYYNSDSDQDIYMVALRDESSELIGYYEKHVVRTKDETPLYDMSDPCESVESEAPCELEIVKENLIKRGFKAHVYATAEDAAQYLKDSVKDVTIGFGGSMTLKSMGLYEVLSENNKVYWHWQPEDGNSSNDATDRAAEADCYFSSANGLSMAGDIINIDGVGNRVSSTLYGHKKVYFIIGKNKLAQTFDEALERARNIAAVKNAGRFEVNTPCKKVGYCMDCASPDRICRELSVLWMCPMGGDYEVILIDEELGF